MPIIFVHGVNTRKGPGYDAGVKATKAFFKKSLAGATIGGIPLGPINDIPFPYWGDLATTFAWNMASLPRGDMEALGAPTQDELRTLLAHVRDAMPGGMTEEPLTTLAQHNFVNAVEVVAAMALDQAEAGREDEIAQFVVAVQQYAAANPHPAWLATTTNDFQFVSNLVESSQTQLGVQSQGLGDIVNFLGGVVINVKNAALEMIGTAVDHVGDFASTKLLGWTREPLNGILGRFFGDIFIYFDGRGSKDAPGKIPQRLLEAIDAAIAGAPADEPLVIIGHSLGGVIMFDLLGHFRPNLHVDLFVTVGSQVAHFEELKLYRTSDLGVTGPKKATVPANIKHWINVYDEVDIFAYAAKGVFDRVDVDARYDTQTYVIKAHGAYFEQARFYERLRARIDAL